MKRSAILAEEAGLSLIELLVVTLILVTLSGLVYATFRYESLAYSRELTRGATQADLRIWSSRMMKDIRNAGFDPLGTAGAGIKSPVTHQDVEFTADVDKNGSINTGAGAEKETLGYRLNASSLQLLQGSSWRTVVTGVTSLNFQYYDVQGNEVCQPNTSCTSVSSIAEVRFTITAQGSDSSTAIAEGGAARIRNPTVQ